jgi:hypothetical protein
VKIWIFWLNLLLNAIALGCACVWVYSHPGFESVVPTLAILASSASLFHSRPHWVEQRAEINNVSQVGNTAGGDIAGRDINKNSNR